MHSFSIASLTSRNPAPRSPSTDAIVSSSCQTTIPTADKERSESPSQYHPVSPDSTSRHVATPESSPQTADQTTPPSAPVTAEAADKVIRALEKQLSGGECSRARTTTVAPDAKVDPWESEKPAHSYLALISMAIFSSPDQKLLLSDIYQFIMDKFPYYNNEERAWRNSIRHNLSLNACFIKCGRAENGKGHYWGIHPACMDEFSRGDYRRRHARRRARRGGLGEHFDISRMPYNYHRSSTDYVPMTHNIGHAANLYAPYLSPPPTGLCVPVTAYPGARLQPVFQPAISSPSTTYAPLGLNPLPSPLYAVSSSSGPSLAYRAECLQSTGGQNTVLPCYIPTAVDQAGRTRPNYRASPYAYTDLIKYAKGHPFNL